MNLGKIEQWWPTDYFRVLVNGDTNEGTLQQIWHGRIICEDGTEEELTEWRNVPRVYSDSTKEPLNADR